MSNRLVFGVFILCSFVFGSRQLSVRSMFMLRFACLLIAALNAEVDRFWVEDVIYALTLLFEE